MNSIDFVAIDLETATRERFSICEVGIAMVKDGQLAGSRSWLVQPPYNQYDYFNVRIHGITPAQTEDCPTFPEVWAEVEPYLRHATVVAHNASFDMYALRDAFHVWHIDYPPMDYYCSYRVAQRVVPRCPSYSLPCICRELGIDFGQHHRAEGDAIGCARVFLECLNRAGATSVEELAQRYGFCCGQFRDQQFTPMRSATWRNNH